MILVGHSLGGVVITEAGADPKVAGLVYVAAFAPDVGVAVGDLGKGFPDPPGLAELRTDAQGYLTMTTKGVMENFAPDLPLAAAKDHRRHARCDERLGVRRQGDQRRLERQAELVRRRRP